MLKIQNKNNTMKYTHNTIGVNLEHDLNLRNTTGSGRNLIELKFAKQVIVLGQQTLTLKDRDEDGGLAVACGGENKDL
jgi:hypothetical protein